MAVNLDNSALKYCATGEACAVNPACGINAWSMFSGVVLDSEQLKVFQSIVVLDSVSVVDVLSCAEITAKVSRHDDTVLKLEAIAHSHSDVSIAANKASCVLDRCAAVH